MITISFFASYRFRHGASLFFVVLCHIFILAFFSRPARLEKTAPSYSMMSIFLVRQSANEKLIASPEKVDVRIPSHFAELKNRVQKPIIVESRNVIDTIKSEQSSPDAARIAKSEVNTISSKELASLDSLARRYNLDIPKVPLVETTTLAQQAAQDPRTNSPRLTKSEQFTVALGSLDCIFQTRLANGKMFRVPGQWVEMPARSEPRRVSLRTVRFCVRAHQLDGEEGGDLSAITAGLRGK